MPIQITSKKVADIKQKAELPKATVSSSLEERNGISGILVSVFYPLPEDDQVEVVERMGKGENKDQVTSRKSVFGRARGVGLTYEQDGETYGILDGEGNQFTLSASILTVVKTAGDEGDEEEATEAAA